MSSQGPNSGATFADDAAVGTLAWSNPGNAAASDDTRATATNASGVNTTHYLKATNFGFSIPAGVTIVGIEVAVERSTSVASSGTLDNSIKLVRSGTISGTDKFGATPWSNTDLVVTYGGPTDLWGLSWTPTIINASDFGVVVQGGTADVLDLRIDHITITVYYDVPISSKPAALARRVTTTMSSSDFIS